MSDNTESIDINVSETVDTGESQNTINTTQPTISS